MRDTPVIGLHGRARSGKDTVANFILAQRGGYIYSFADPIRVAHVDAERHQHGPNGVGERVDVATTLRDGSTTGQTGP
jgi:dephospho-CoA kinase